jgi:hypothetical protein
LEPSQDFVEVRAAVWRIAYSVPQKIVGFAAAAIDRVVAAAGIGNDGEQRGAVIGIKMFPCTLMVLVAL